MYVSFDCTYLNLIYTKNHSITLHFHHNNNIFDVYRFKYNSITFYRSINLQLYTAFDKIVRTGSADSPVYAYEKLQSYNDMFKSG